MKKLFTILTLCLALTTFAQETDSTTFKPEINVKWTDKPIKIDGKLNDEAWNDAEPYDNFFFQRQPLDREPSSEKTKVMVVQNENMIYFGIQCYDSEPEKIFASTMRRDKTFGSGDVLELLLDTFQDNRNCYSFDTNPLGGKGDAIISDRGNHINKQWECVIYVDGDMNETGWAAEFGIPFKSIKYKKGDVTEWNINISRDIKHRQEQTYLIPISRDLGHAAKFRGELFGKLKNIRPPKKGLNFEVYPFVLGGLLQDFSNGTDQTTQLNNGIDFKYDITSQLALDLTLNTDFAQAEADEEIVNVTRFNIQREEKRQFFLQSAGLFQFGPGGYGQNHTFRLFDSRTIGTKKGERIPLAGGAKLTGRVGDYSIAVMNMQSKRTHLDDGSVEPSTNYSVIRLKRNVMKNSSIGVMALNQEATSTNYSRAFGVDGLWTINPKMILDASVARSISPDVNDSDMAGDIGFEIDEKWYDFGIRYTRIDSLFNPKMGFVRRANIRSTDVDAALTKWINNDYLQSIGLSSGMTYLTDHADVLQTRDVPIRASAVFKKGDQISFGLTNSYEFVPVQSYIRDIAIPMGSYETINQNISFRSYRARPINGSINLRWGELFDGHQKSASVSGSAKLSNHLNVDLSFSHNNIDLKAGSLESNVLSTRWTYSFTPDFYAKTYLQWNTADERFSGNFIIDYAYRPKSHIYLVYNEIQDTQFSKTTDRIIMLKMTYLWQI